MMGLTWTMKVSHVFPFQSINHCLRLLFCIFVCRIDWFQAALKNYLFLNLVEIISSHFANFSVTYISAQSIGSRHHRRMLSRTEEDHGPRQYSADGSAKQSSSTHLSVTSLYSSSNDCDEDPIMV